MSKVQSGISQFFSELFRDLRSIHEFWGVNLVRMLSDEMSFDTLTLIYGLMLTKKKKKAVDKNPKFDISKFFKQLWQSIHEFLGSESVVYFQKCCLKISSHMAPKKKRQKDKLYNQPFSRSKTMLKVGNVPNHLWLTLNINHLNVQCDLHSLSIPPKPKFWSVSLYDQRFARHKVVENQKNQKCTEWPQTDPKCSNAKITLHTLSPHPRGTYFGTFHSTASHFPGALTLCLTFCQMKPT